MNRSDFTGSVFPPLLKATVYTPMDQKALAVAGVCSCDHENSNLDSP